MLLNKISCRKKLLCLLGILAIVFLTFSPCLNNGFTNWDDPVYLLENKSIQGLSLPHVKKIFTSYVHGSYLPLSSLSFALEYHFFKFNPKIYHLDNILLHMGNVALAFWFIYLISGNLRVSLATALLFGINPLRVESVAWVAERKDLLFSFFYLGTLISYFLSIKHKPYANPLLRLSFLLFICSALSKPQAVSLPAVLLLLDYLAKRRWTKELLIEKIPFFAVAGGFFLLNFAQILPTVPTLSFYGDFSSLEKVFFILSAVIIYLWNSLLPVRLSILYPYPQTASGAIPFFVYLSPVVIFLGLWLLVKMKKFSREVRFGCLFILLTLLLPLGNIWLGATFISDRYMYLSSLGLFYLLSQGFFSLMEKAEKKNSSQKKSWIKIIAVGYVAGMALISFNRCAAWKDTIVLWSDVIRKYPKISIAYNSRGSAWLGKGQEDLALADFEEALRLNPDLAESHHNKGLLLTKRGEAGLALHHFNKAISLDPQNALFYAGRGTLLLLQQQPKTAIADFTKAIELDPELAQAYANRGAAHFLLEEDALAVLDFTKTIEIEPRNTDAYRNRSVVYNRLKDFPKAAADAAKAKSLR